MIISKTNMGSFPENCYKCKYAYTFDIANKYCVQNGMAITSKGCLKRMKYCPLMEVEDETV